MPKHTDKPLVYGNVPHAIRDLFDSWVAALPKSKQRGLLMSACLMTAANNAEMRDDILRQLLQADALGQATDLITQWVNEDNHTTGPSMKAQSAIELKMPQSQGKTTKKPRRAAKASRHKKLSDESPD